MVKLEEGTTVTLNDSPQHGRASRVDVSRTNSVVGKMSSTTSRLRLTGVPYYKTVDSNKLDAEEASRGEVIALTCPKHATSSHRNACDGCLSDRERGGLASAGGTQATKAVVATTTAVGRVLLEVGTLGTADHGIGTARTHIVAAALGPSRTV